MASKSYLKRFDRIWIEDPLYFITTSVAGRKRILEEPEVQEVFIEVWRNAQDLYHWSVGRYVIMPDHVHFFCMAHRDGVELSRFVGKWKEWTAKYLCARLGFAAPVWQTRFFDHILRSQESYSLKWDYVRMNPVRAGLVTTPDEWPLQGELNPF